MLCRWYIDELKDSTDIKINQFFNKKNMAKQTINNIKLGLFVIAGFAFYVDVILGWKGY